MKTIHEAVEISREMFESSHYCCAESVLLAIAAHQGIESELLMPMATGFCGGVAQTRGMCGAVSGAVMGLGLITGRREPGGDRTANYAAVRGFVDAFQALHNTVNCYELTGCDFTTPEGQEQFREQNIAVRCTEYVAEATRLALHAVENGSE